MHRGSGSQTAVRKVALVTGGSKRIGRCVAETLHAAGFDVGVHYNHSEAEAKALVALLCQQRAASAIALQCPLNDAPGSGGGVLKDHCTRLIAAMYDAFGGLDVLVNSASSFFPTPIVSPSSPSSTDAATATDDEALCEMEWDLLMGSNAKAPWYLTKAFAAQHMMELNRVALSSSSTSTGSAVNSKSIVNITDAMLHRPLKHYTVYTMSKHALLGLTRSASMELAPLHIRVNAVAPGYNVFPPAGCSEASQAAMRLEVPLGRREGSPMDVANAVKFLVSPEAAYVTGQTIDVDGGLSLQRSDV